MKKRQIICRFTYFKNYITKPSPGSVAPDMRPSVSIRDHVRALGLNSDIERSSKLIAWAYQAKALTEYV